MEKYKGTGFLCILFWRLYLYHLSTEILERKHLFCWTVLEGNLIICKANTIVFKANTIIFKGNTIISKEMQLFSKEIQLFSKEIQLFSKKIQLFSNQIELFPNQIQVSLKQTQLFSWTVIGSFWGKYKKKFATLKLCLAQYQGHQLCKNDRPGDDGMLRSV